MRPVSVGRGQERAALLALPEIGCRKGLLTGDRAAGPAGHQERMLHLPILRWGQPYRSVNQVVTPHFRTRDPFVSMSQANVGLIRRDLLKQADARALLQHIPVKDLVAMAARAAEHFLNDTLALD